MNHLSAVQKIVTQSRYFGPGRVLEVDLDDGRVLLTLEDGPNADPVSAQVALADSGPLEVGDTVLVLGDAIAALYIIGVITRTQPRTQHLSLAGGAHATLGEDADSEILRVFSKSSQLVFEYDAEKEVARVNLTSGDIEFSAQDGDIILNASRKIRMQASSIDVTAQHRVRLGVEQGIGKRLAGLFVSGQRANLTAEVLGIKTKRGEFQVDEMHYLGHSFLARVERAQLVAKRIETIAETVVEKAKNTYRSVEELAQVTVGRMKTLVHSTYHLKSKRVYLKAQKDVKINGEKIHLG